MIEKNTMSNKQAYLDDRSATAAVFSFQSETAKAVFLTGEFNDWDPTANPMLRSDDGEWTASLELAPGRYEYKFVVDGEWCCEPGCTALSVERGHCIINVFGTMNRVREVM